MIEEQAVVVAVEGDRAHLEIRRNAPCGLCGTTQGCGVSLWGRLFKRTKGGFWTTNPLQATVGDAVIIGIEEGALLAGSLTAYLVPLLLICAGALVGSWSSVSRSGSDAAAVLGAIAGLIAGLAWVKFQTQRRRLDGRYQPVMLRRGELMSIRHCSR
jgi:sigma-E factor negative regulatory protein RseC